MKKFFVAVAVAALVLPLTAQAASAQPTFQHVALGDSFASGVGNLPYQPGTETTCRRSYASVSWQTGQLLAQKGSRPLDLRDVSCSGAKIDDLYRVYNGEGPQLDQLQSGTDWVTLTIGGNDIGYGPYARKCLEGDCHLQPTYDVINQLRPMGLKLHKLLKDIRTRSPHARIIVVGYGQPVTEKPGITSGDPICGLMNDNERMAAAVVSLGLDSVIRAVILTTYFSGDHNISFTSPYDNPEFFEGHSLCEGPQAEALYFGLSDDPYRIFHPRVAWHSQMARQAYALAG